MSAQDNINSQELSQEEIYVEEERSLHYYRTEIPNCVLDAQLDPFCFLVYAQIKRISGDKGKCFMSIPHLAKKIGISETKLKECLSDLCKKNSYLNISLLKKKVNKREDGSFAPCIYTIIDLWPYNMQMFSGIKEKFGGSPHDGGVGRNATGGGSPHDWKEEPNIRKNHIITTTPTPSESEVEKQKSDVVVCEKIFFKNAKGGRDFAFKKDAFLWALNYPTDLVEEAIALIENSQPLITNFKKYFLGVCDNLVVSRQKKANEEGIQIKRTNWDEEEEKRKLATKIHCEKLAAHKAAGLPHSGDFFKKSKEWEALGKDYSQSEEYKEIRAKKKKINEEIDEKYKNKNA